MLTIYFKYTHTELHCRYISSFLSNPDIICVFTSLEVCDTILQFAHSHLELTLFGDLDCLDCSGLQFFKLNII